MSPILAGFLASLAAGLLTAVGAVPVLMQRHVSRSVSDVMLGFAAGVMLAAAFFSLILPGLETAVVLFGGRLYTGSDRDRRRFAGRALRRVSQ